MVARVRGALGKLRTAAVVFAPLCVLWGGSAGYSQQNPPPRLRIVPLETADQTNERIQQLASLDQPRTTGVPVGPGDLLHIDVFDVPELSRDVRVSETGEISFPLIPGKIAVSGETPFQVEAQFDKLLAENGLVSHPQVSVFVREQNSQPVSVIGAVRQPRIYQIFRPTTLLEVLAAAGGIADDAGDTLMITRPVAAAPGKPPTADSTDPPPPGSGSPSAEVPPGSNAPEEAASHPAAGAPNSSKSETITIRLRDLLESGNPAFNIRVYGGDVVSVTRAGIIYVMGSGISQPGGYVVEGRGDTITVLKAVALAHGLNNFAKADNSVILRTDPLTGKQQEIHVPLKRIERRKAPDMPMRANDILYIPDSTGRKVLARGAESAIGVGTGVAVYRAGTY